MRLIQSVTRRTNTEKMNTNMFTSPVAEGLGQIAENGIQSTN